MRLIIITVAILTALLVYTFGYANAAPPCGPSEKMENHLRSKYKEQVIGAGIVAGGKRLFKLFVSPSGTWSIVLENMDGSACIMSAGSNWHDQPLQDIKPKT